MLATSRRCIVIELLPNYTSRFRFEQYTDSSWLGAFARRTRVHTRAEGEPPASIRRFHLQSPGRLLVTIKCRGILGIDCGISAWISVRTRHRRQTALNSVRPHSKEKTFAWTGTATGMSYIYIYMYVHTICMGSVFPPFVRRGIISFFYAARFGNDCLHTPNIMAFQRQTI